MKLTATIQVSVDGVMQANGGTHPDLDPGFERGGWALPLFDDEAHGYVDEVYERADAFLFGRRTYEFFAGTWGAIEQMADSRIGRALNTRRKYVASSTLTDPGWAPATVVSGAAAVRELAAAPGGELQVHGSGALTRWLLANDLVDELNLLVVPVIVGRGTRLLPADGPRLALDLVESRAFPKGITLQMYRPARG
ncbi:dihydrofolate reductase family protein [Jiangella anatolica]|uniref:Deaminase n=1 Tax=Jiangella anatolica TaxID=2670374 RepID=A0A2W2BUS8_9ACTN|nr:dihydrofolate reductase family protein [Jiangella anatolica]PZF84144.1 deaminase [Jiangella anatolica]